MANKETARKLSGANHMQMQEDFILYFFLNYISCKNWS